jgi:RNA polymerase sigma factor (sigma-70 family)
VNGYYSNRTDRELLEGLAHHDEEALQLLYKEYFPMISRMVFQNHGDESDAKDLFQDTLIVLYEKSKDPVFVLECKLKTYLYAVGHRLWLKQLHQRQKQFIDHVSDEEEIAEDINSDIEAHEAKEARFRIMNVSMAKLGEPCKSLLESFYLYKLSMQEIAEKFGYTNPDNAKTQKYKCLSRLKKIFFNQYKNTEIL